jgi:hypothetical protein
MRFHSSKWRELCGERRTARQSPLLDCTVSVKTRISSGALSSDGKQKWPTTCASWIITTEILGGNPDETRAESPSSKPGLTVELVALNEEPGNGN